MTDPKTTHTVEQGIASFRAVAGCFSAFYRELVDVGGIHADHALQLTLEYMRSWLVNARQMPPPTEPSL